MDGDGDIYRPENLIAFRDFVLRNTDGHGVHFMMADGVRTLKNDTKLFIGFSLNIIPKLMPPKISIFTS